MPRFLITMNMPTKSGSSVHQLIAEHSAVSLEDFLNELQSNDFVIVDEYYKDTYGEYYNTGKTMINHRFVGKVRVFGDATHARRNDNRPALANGD